MEHKMGLGASFEIEAVVDKSTVASSFGSGGLDVYATPYMIAVMEAAALKAVAPYLDEGCSTVGTQVNVSHLAATPIGVKVVTKATLTAIDERKLTFDVEAHAVYGGKTEKIGFGTHERFIINEERFMQKLSAPAR